MTPAELVRACHEAKRAMEAGANAGHARPSVLLKIPGTAWGEHRRLAGRAGPLGYVLCVNVEDGAPVSVCRFFVDDVLAWLAKQGACTGCMVG